MKKLGGHRHDNPSYYFREGITYSITGIYAPTFRLNSSSVFDVKGSCVFSESIPLLNLLLILNSKLAKLLWKNFVMHTVDTQVDVIKSLTIEHNKIVNSSLLKKLVFIIIEKQKSNPRYDYMTNEQVEIDRLVYQIYNLNEDDIKEVEDWYFRRYPKLARVIEQKLRAKQETEE